ncbi:hypothetical protein HMPREF2992_09585 [Prevotella sp. HMSC069G02]|nr:hypothetical protein HMPREF2992_09585 [Prevotella sp. HMSC069G02]
MFAIFFSHKGLYSLFFFLTLYAQKRNKRTFIIPYLKRNYLQRTFDKRKKTYGEIRLLKSKRNRQTAYSQLF